MSLLLSIDTAGTVCAAAVSESSTVRAKRVLDEPRVHAAKLVPMIRDLVAEVGCAMGDLEAIAVSKGPGSFTGLRIGVSTAKGVCFGLDIPLIGIETFRAMAAANPGVAGGQQRATATILPSRRGEAYWQLWSAGGRAPEPITSPQSDRFEKIAASLQGQDSEITLVGEVPEKMMPVLALSGARVRLLSGADANPTIDGVVLLAAEALEESEFEDVAEFEPYYLKEFIAKKGGSPFDRLPF